MSARGWRAKGESLPTLGRWAAIWMAVAVFSGSWLVTVQRVEARGSIFDRALAIQLGSYLLWALLAVPMVVAARRVPWRPGHRLRAFVARLGLALVAALAHSVCQATLLAATLPASLVVEGWRATLAHLVRFQIHFNLLVAALVLSADLVLGWYRSSAEQRLEAARLEERLVKARLAASRLRLRPRFLFETLSTIRARLRATPAEAERLVLELAALLRAVLEGSRHPDGTVRDELELAGLFLGLERERLGAQLTWQLDADEDALGCEVPSLVLVPLVDEAVALAAEAGARSIHLVLRAGVIGQRGYVELRVATEGALAAVGTAALAAARQRLAESFAPPVPELVLAHEAGGVLRLRLELPPPAHVDAESAGVSATSQEVLWSRS